MDVKSFWILFTGKVFILVIQKDAFIRFISVFLRRAFALVVVLLPNLAPKRDKKTAVALIAQAHSTVGIETCATGSIDANIAGLATRMAPTWGMSGRRTYCNGGLGCPNLSACSILYLIPYMNHHKYSFSLSIKNIYHLLKQILSPRR